MARTSFFESVLQKPTLTTENQTPPSVFDTMSFVEPSSQEDTNVEVIRTTEVDAENPYAFKESDIIKRNGVLKQKTMGVTLAAVPEVQVTTPFPDGDFQSIPEPTKNDDLSGSDNLQFVVEPETEDKKLPDDFEGYNISNFEAMLPEVNRSRSVVEPDEPKIIADISINAKAIEENNLDKLKKSVSKIKDNLTKIKPSIVSTPTTKVIEDPKEDQSTITVEEEIVDTTVELKEEAPVEITQTDTYSPTMDHDFQEQVQSVVKSNDPADEQIPSFGLKPEQKKAWKELEEKISFLLN